MAAGTVQEPWLLPAAAEVLIQDTQASVPSHQPEVIAQQAAAAASVAASFLPPAQSLAFRTTGRLVAPLPLGGKAGNRGLVRSHSARRPYIATSVLTAVHLVSAGK